MIETQTPEEIATRLRDSYKEALSGIVAIDGRDGAGKSCLAKKLQKLIGGAIVSLDDFLEQNQGGYVEYLNLTAIRAALDQVVTPKIIEGCCMLEIIGRVGCKQNILIYVKKVTRYPTGDFYWVDGDMLDRDPTEPLEDLVRRKAFTGTTEDIIRYHDKYRPSRQAEIVFLQPCRK